jgi:hypothetical protein
MNETMEYMAFGGIYGLRASDNRLRPEGDASFVKLLDNRPLYQQMGKVTRSRVESELAWQHQRASYRGVYERLPRVPAQELEMNTRLPEPSGD